MVGQLIKPPGVALLAFVDPKCVGQSRTFWAPSVRIRPDKKEGERWDG